MKTQENVLEAIAISSIELGIPSDIESIGKWLSEKRDVSWREIEKITEMAKKLSVESQIGNIAETLKEGDTFSMFGNDSTKWIEAKDIPIKIIEKTMVISGLTWILTTETDAFVVFRHQKINRNGYTETTLRMYSLDNQGVMSFFRMTREKEPKIVEKIKKPSSTFQDGKISWGYGQTINDLKADRIEKEFTSKKVVGKKKQFIEMIFHKIGG